MSNTTALRSSAAAEGRFPPVIRIPAACFVSTGGIFPPWKLSFTSSFHLRRVAISGARTQECVEVIENDLEVIKWPEKIVEDDALTNDDSPKLDEITRLVGLVRSRLQNMDDGEISISPYDTAWVALVEDIGGVGGGRKPQFPASLDWISKNQLGDGSWGDEKKFSAHDRIMNTLACVVALRYWKMHPDKTNKGISFIRENIYKLEEENMEQMPIGFEVALPSLIEIARNLGIDIPNDSPGLQEIYTRRDLKLQRIPRDVMHQVPTTLLHSLEGVPDLDWQKLLRLQSPDGSFLFSPSSTAFALQQTKDQNCLQYLTKNVRKFNGGVPNVYPVDLFERLWVVDRLQRLGISRFFQPEIDECIEYVHRYWTEKGICWARNSEIQDIDDTSMGFRLLRLHGYEVHADVFKQFENGGEFFCFAGQSDQAVTGMYNLYRASQMKFPGEDILTDARNFSSNFLQEKRANNELLDKWIITKDLPGEVGYALDVPWYASLPRLETRLFLEQYGGDDDVWIGKTLYRMSNVNNKTYLELAKLDYNNCQAVHQQEWKSIQKWYRDCNIEEHGLSEKSLLVGYFMAAATIFEAENSAERLAWAKTATLMETVARQQLSRQQKRDFVNEFRNGYKTRNSLAGTVIRTLSQLSLDALVARVRDIHGLLYEAWLKWLTMWEEEEEEEEDAELLLRVINLSGDDDFSRNNLLLEDISLVWHPHYQHLLAATNKVCRKLRLFRNQKVLDGNGGITTVEIESDMEELVKLVLTKSSGDFDFNLKQKFLHIARSFYYTAYCNPRTISFHIHKVLFERVI